MNMKGLFVNCLKCMFLEYQYVNQLVFHLNVDHNKI
jgi:hypothetical protein